MGSRTDCQLPVREFEPKASWALRRGHPHIVVAGDCAVCARRGREEYLLVHLYSGATRNAGHVALSVDRRGAADGRLRTLIPDDVCRTGGIVDRQPQAARSVLHTVGSRCLDRAFLPVLIEES